ncbi:hypothetical protein KC357_g103 [Hortaea werneckii]|nr:hypothetical protein KC357_g103 [Hortaea werneckii]
MVTVVVKTESVADRAEVVHRRLTSRHTRPVGLPQHIELRFLPEPVLIRRRRSMFHQRDTAHNPCQEKRQKGEVYHWQILQQYEAEKHACGDVMYGIEVNAKFDETAVTIT